MAIQALAVDGVEVFIELAQTFIEIIQDIAEANIDWKGTLKLLAMPLKILLEFVNKIPPGLLEMYLQFKLINSIIPITTALTWSLTTAMNAYAASRVLSMGSSLAGGGGGLSYAAFRAANTGAGAAAWKKGGAMNLAYKAQKGGTAARVAPTLARGASIARFGMMGSLGVAGLALGGGYLAYKHFTKEKAAGGYLTPMAQGGFPSGGSPYLVGEQGPELFVPETAGQLLNNGATQSNMGSGMVMKNVVIGIDSFGGIA
jgi:hypothetical protein